MSNDTFIYRFGIISLQIFCILAQKCRCEDFLYSFKNTPSNKHFLSIEKKNVSWSRNTINLLRFNLRFFSFLLFLVYRIIKYLIKLLSFAEEGDFKLQPGSTYTYDYETTTSTTVQGSSQDKTQIQLTAQVDIEVLSKCDLSVRVSFVFLLYKIFKPFELFLLSYLERLWGDYESHSKTNITLRKFSLFVNRLVFIPYFNTS